MLRMQWGEIGKRTKKLPPEMNLWAQKKLRQLTEFYQKAEAGELEPFSFNSVYQLVLHLSRLLSVAFL